ncbi:MAG: hypothetical protein KDB35_01535 [Acidimicrobiales bacterium]|nr:hypothetical protein [Acidimicrobiales bacterium]
MFIDGDVTVGIRRWDHGKGADGKIHIGIYASRSPDQLTVAFAANEVASGLEIISRLVAADERLQGLFDLYGTEITYLNDYGMGAAALAHVSDDGSLTWVEGLRPAR